MKRTWLLALGAAVLLNMARGEEFTRSLSAANFAEAGLNKLSPAELARLDELIEARLQGKVEQVKVEADKRVAAEVAKQKPPEGILHRMKVVLTPGTEVTYSTVESTLVGPFRGYEKGTLLTLANGQSWRVEEGSYWSPKREANKVRKVVIKPGVLGSFYMQIEGANTARVAFVSGKD